MAEAYENTFNPVFPFLPARAFEQKIWPLSGTAQGKHNQRECRIKLPVI